MFYRPRDTEVLSRWRWVYNAVVIGWSKNLKKMCVGSLERHVKSDGQSHDVVWGHMMNSEELLLLSRNTLHQSCSTKTVVCYCYNPHHSLDSWTYIIAETFMARRQWRGCSSGSEQRWWWIKASLYKVSFMGHNSCGGVGPVWAIMFHTDITAGRSEGRAIGLQRHNLKVLSIWNLVKRLPHAETPEQIDPFSSGSCCFDTSCS